MQTETGEGDRHVAVRLAAARAANRELMAQLNATARRS